MRVAFLAAVFAAASTLAILACSSDEASATPDGDTTPDTDADPTPGGEDDEPVDSGQKFAPNGCPLKSTPFMVGKKVENVARGSGPSWTNVENAATDDGQFAETTITDGEETAEIRISDFGIDLPEDAETWGIVVELKRQTFTDGGTVQSGAVSVELGKQSDFKTDKASFYWPTKIIGRHGYGQEVDTWGADIYPADFERTDFAAKLWARKMPDGGVSGPVKTGVDSLKVQVWYCSKE